MCRAWTRAAGGRRGRRRRRGGPARSGPSGDFRDAGDLVILVLEADQRGPDGHAADEVAGAVDGVDDPAKAGGPGRVTRFLAEEAVVRKLGPARWTAAAPRPRGRPRSPGSCPPSTRRPHPRQSISGPVAPPCWAASIGNLVTRTPVGIHKRPPALSVVVITLR